MIYTVIIQPPAEADIESAYQYIRTDSKNAADRWLLGLINAIQSLENMPNRCGLARENREFKEEIRQLHYGRRHNSYRIIFVVHVKRVLVLRVLHGARESIYPEDL
ncbi:MAG TPA: type II toxin-antitoxin system RelE/ParE family toxin [Tepidisphaeraceae bacterium]|nr:type II toxin-antitoxin system RelE/ParE family toxin [Tepidisphaeraceae bacterium]